MTRLLSLALLGATASFAAVAAPSPKRVRGTVVSIAPDTLVVRPAAGADVSVALTPDTRFSTVSKASLADIKPDTYIGTAAKGDGDTATALEVLIFPQALRGTGEGHYGWDRIADPTASGEAASMMTNGTVASSMTEGAATPTGGSRLTVTYKGGQQTVVVPPSTPIVLLHPGADRATVKAGERVFVSALDDDGKLTARGVTVGEAGVPPPM